ncbi:ExeA family protein [Vibrio ostreicida]|uniref:AAA family ATPase n=1 Tax=Vibrio ostreicida TaxID=526588 RepID=A0ABT8BMF4_9VIBR|nr:AAA family ATPase [Vibrio ostreicida]MDN3608296.1 AAA family ATPase [Vibrio ostreicida]NPD09720.1 AAA family ATPase [Vibrio ostreicida]
MYLEHFGFTQLPFNLTPNTALFLGLEPHYEAIQTVQSAIEMGEGMIKVTGEVGTGKTMVCRILVNQLSQDIQIVYLPNPALDGEELRKAIAVELDIKGSDQTTLVDEIQSKLIRLARNEIRVVVFVDEAQSLSDEALEVLRLFGNLETEQNKLLQIVLLGQPELDQRLEHYHLRQLRQRITFSAQLRTLTLAEVVAYIDNRIDKSGGKPRLFRLSQKKAIWKASRGIPRLINQICHKCLVLSASEGRADVGNEHLYRAIHDTYDCCKPKFKSPLFWGWSLS